MSIYLFLTSFAKGNTQSATVVVHWRWQLYNGLMLVLSGDLGGDGHRSSIAAEGGGFGKHLFWSWRVTVLFAKPI